MKKFLKWFLIVIAVLAVIGAIIERPKDRKLNISNNNDVKDSSETSNNKSVKEDSKEKVYSLGETYKSDFCNFTIKKAEAVKTITRDDSILKYEVDDENNIYLLLTVDYENTSNNRTDFLDLYFNLKINDEINYAFTSFTFKKDGNFDITPSVEAKANNNLMLFAELPKKVLDEAKKAELIFGYNSGSNNMFDTKKDNYISFNVLSAISK